MSKTLDTALVEIISITVIGIHLIDLIPISIIISAVHGELSRLPQLFCLLNRYASSLAEVCSRRSKAGVASA